MRDSTLPFASDNSASGGADRLEPDYRDAYADWKMAQTPRTRAALLRKVQPVINQALTSYGRGASPGTRSQARLAAINAFKSYDRSRGTLKTHLLSQLQRLQRTAAKQEQIISMPEQVSLDRNHVIQAEKRLYDLHGRDPSDAEIADSTGLSLKRLAYIRQGKGAVNTGSLLGESGELYSPVSRVPGQDSGNSAWQEFIYHDLGPTDQAVMDYTLGLHGAPVLPTQEIAKRLGVTPGAISQRTTRIQDRLDQAADISPFGS